MANILKSVKKQLSDYLSGRTSFKEFHSWLVIYTWGLRDIESSINAYIGMIKLRIAEYTSYHWSEEELKDLLSKIKYE